ncbi:MAG: AAA family ATPase, partial [Bacteroidetes bacterium]|nr:AAA family ATPase [Bacteroidota bacterium]
DALEIGESDFQREVIDALAGQADLLQQYQGAYQLWRQYKKTLDELQEQKIKFTSEYDYNKFLYEELEEAGFKENELEEMDAELKLLSNSESIKAALDRANYELADGEQPVVQQIKALLHQLQPFGDYHPALPALLQRLQSAQIELVDIAGELSHINDHVQHDPRRIGEINERLSKGYRLLKKHGLQNTNELLSLQEGLSSKLKAVLDMDDAIAAAAKQTEQSLAQAGTLAAKLSASRAKQVKPLEEKVNTLLAQVGMPNARLKVSIQPLPAPGPDGADAVEFLFDANKSNRFEPVHKVASGGELSRLMLCIKSLVAQSLDLPTLIFDEIDTGISGEAAKQVGIIMKDLAKKRQVIAITHQPQIAGRADAHYFVYKENKKNAVKTNIRLLSDEERITAIAQMLSGEKPTAAALENAREMV